MSKGSRTRDKIVEAALREASLIGLEGLTIGGLSASMAMSKSGLFAHFGSKEALQQAVIDRLVGDFTETVAAPALEIPPGRARLRAVMENWIAWSAAPERPGGCSMAAAAFEYDAKPGEIRDAVAKMFADWRRFLADCAREAQRIDLDPALDPERLASDLLGVYFSQHLERWLLNEPDAGARALERIDALLIPKA